MYAVVMEANSNGIEWTYSAVCIVKKSFLKEQKNRLIPEFLLEWDDFVFVENS